MCFGEIGRTYWVGEIIVQGCEVRIGVVGCRNGHVIELGVCLPECKWISRVVCCLVLRLPCRPVSWCLVVLL